MFLKNPRIGGLTTALFAASFIALVGAGCASEKGHEGEFIGGAKSSTAGVAGSPDTITPPQDSTAGATGDTGASGGTSDTITPTPSVASVCGNGILESGETCDDGNTMSLDGCSSTCLIESGYTCPTAGLPCTPTPVAPVCGNGTVEAGEACDDGNTTPGDGCSADCKTVETGYTCTGTPKSTCTAASVCGNSIVETGEACDDGNTTPGDGCSADCKTVETGFTCTTDPSTKKSTCTAAIACGNGIVETGEACDDGNTTPGDGCSADCKTVESGFACTTDPSTKKSTCTACGSGKGQTPCADGFAVSLSADIDNKTIGITFTEEPGTADILNALKSIQVYPTGSTTSVSGTIVSVDGDPKSMCFKADQPFSISPPSYTLKVWGADSTLPNGVYAAVNKNGQPMAHAFSRDFACGSGKGQIPCQ